PTFLLAVAVVVPDDFASVSRYVDASLVSRGAEMDQVRTVGVDKIGPAVGREEDVRAVGGETKRIDPRHFLVLECGDAANRHPLMCLKRLENADAVRGIRVPLRGPGDRLLAAYADIVAPGKLATRPVDPDSEEGIAEGGHLSGRNNDTTRRPG